MTTVIEGTYLNNFLLPFALITAFTAAVIFLTVRLVKKELDNETND